MPAVNASEKAKEKAELGTRIASRLSLVRVTGLEPAQPCDHKNLNLTRLPIPPHPLMYRAKSTSCPFYAEQSYYSILFPACQVLFSVFMPLWYGCLGDNRSPGNFPARGSPGNPCHDPLLPIRTHGRHFPRIFSRIYRAASTM